jgi:hypothetical protein
VTIARTQAGTASCVNTPDIALVLHGGSRASEMTSIASRASPLNSGTVVSPRSSPRRRTVGSTSRTRAAVSRGGGIDPTDRPIVFTAPGSVRAVALTGRPASWAWPPHDPVAEQAAAESLARHARLDTRVRRSLQNRACAAHRGRRREVGWPR